MADARRRLIVNADDFGLSPGVTRGILEAVDADIVTSVSVMVNLPTWDDTAVRLGGVASVAAVGLHLNLTTGKPLTRAASLVDGRTSEFLPLHVLAMRAATGRIVESHVDAEVAAQFARLDDARVPLTHLNGHHHVHLIPIVWRCVAQRASGRGLRVRVPVEPVAWGIDGPAMILKKAALRAAARRTVAGHMRDRGQATVHFRGLSLYGARDPLALLLRALDTLPVGVTELMAHPGYEDAALRKRDHYRALREVELRALTARAVRERLASCDIQLERPSATAMRS